MLISLILLVAAFCYIVISTYHRHNGIKKCYFDNEIIWRTSDGYNPDINGTNYDNLINELSEIGRSYDKLKSDLIYRFLTPESSSLTSSLMPISTVPKLTIAHLQD